MTAPTSRRSRSRASARPFEGSATGPSLHYVLVPDDIPFVNRGRFWSGGRLVGRAPRLVITQDRVLKGVDLWFCDNRWHIRHGTSAPSVAEAKRRAEQFYPGLAAHWTDLRVTAATARRYMERLRREHGCSFCHRAPGEHGVSQAQAGEARICASCVADLHKEMDPERGLRAASPNKRMQLTRSAKANGRRGPRS